MRTTQPISITLPRDMAEAVARKVESGAYASVSEVLREGVRALLDRDAAVERWLREEVAQSYDEYKANPSSAIPAEQVMLRIRDRAAARRDDATKE
ncbi:type II toxin-antitoxin system ParD family antitoxin [Mesorhizobium sp. C280B]|uniref:ribbon-helix-helix domain-containing protein n=1 Tax=unclassified Mesorhizobium TaxID=325217 RepID=UPI0003CDE809|nr:type II toxin-antitoxin system ParD family antitoxin [Mesorhizobium sp. LSJC280B00]ESW92836.1 plasmid stabilization protein [Mesorhizobium sp. LSJC280B00]